MMDDKLAKSRRRFFEMASKLGGLFAVHGFLVGTKSAEGRSIPMAQEILPSDSVIELPAPITVNKARVFVNPPKLGIGSGNKRLTVVPIVNNTGSTVRIWFPQGKLLFDSFSNGTTYERSPDFSQPIAVAHKSSLNLYVRSNPKDGQYQYHVYCEAIEDYAEGNSPPVMICP